MTLRPEWSCLCGARDELAEGSPDTVKCWHCGKMTMRRWR